MAATGAFLQGKHLTAVSVTALTRAADGTLSVAVVKDVQAIITENDFQMEPTHEDIGPVTIDGANNVITTDDSTLNMAVLLLNSGENPLATVFMSYDYMLVEWTRGAQGYAYYCTRGTFGDTVNSRGANYQRVSFRRIEIGAGNPVYA